MSKFTTKELNWLKNIDRDRLHNFLLENCWTYHGSDRYLYGRPMDDNARVALFTFGVKNPSFQEDADKANGKAIAAISEALDIPFYELLKLFAKPERPTWDRYFMAIASLAATRSTCLATPVGAVIVRDNQIVSTGYNGVPSGSAHCTDRGFCYEGSDRCDKSSLPSRAIHAEANAIAQAAKNGIKTEGAKIYVTMEPCLSCLKLIIAAGIKEVFYGTSFNSGVNAEVRDSFLNENLIKLTKVENVAIA